jgi:hypothetical protein
MDLAAKLLGAQRKAEGEHRYRKCAKDEEQECDPHSIILSSSCLFPGPFHRLLGFSHPVSDLRRRQPLRLIGF